MKILVTGASGYVGTAVVPALVQAGHDVRALVRGGSARALPASQRLAPVVGNALDPASVASALAGCDAVVHLLGTRRADIKRTHLTYDDIDVGSVRVMVGAMRGAGVSRILLLSAGAIGNSVYVQAKARAERIVMEPDLAWTIFRPSFILGPGQQWPRVLEPVLATMSYFPGGIGDVARRARAVTREELAASMVWALENPQSAGMILNVPLIREHGRGSETVAGAG